MKLFGTTRSGSRLPRNRKAILATAAADDSAVASYPAKRRNPLKGLAIFLGCLLLIEILYFVAIYSDNSFISKWRTIYIETAMDTLSHKWLATAIIPPDIIEDVMDQRRQAIEQQIGMSSSWNKEDEEQDAATVEEETGPDEMEADVEVPPQVDPEEVAEENFYTLFYEIDKPSLEAYLSEHPEALQNGWDNLYINEAGLDDSGTSIQTIHGEQVLAIDAKNQVLLVRVSGSGYLGVLAIAKDPSRLSLYPSSQLGVTGEYSGTIAENHNGIIGIAASGFIDPNGNGNGGTLAGYALCDGTAYGSAHMGWGYKRLELHEDDLFYIKDASDPVSEDATDAVEFQPALIIDGTIVVDSNCGWTALQPRTCIGQSDKYEILMLVIEGRMPLRSTGTHVIECAEILKRHGCMQAMNLDGGTSAMMWFDGEYITKCSNQSLPYGRPLPTAFVYKRAE